MENATKGSTPQNLEIVENIGVVFIKSIKSFLVKRELIGITRESIVTTPKMLAAWVELAQFPLDQSIGMNIRSIIQNIP